MRLFIAICLDDETKNAVFAAEKEAEKSAEGRFSLRENLHLTLVFIGETERKEDIEKIISEMDSPKFDIKINSIGTFEKGIFFAGTEKSKSLSLLQGNLAERTFTAERISLMKSENAEGVLRYTEIFSKNLY